MLIVQKHSDSDFCYTSLILYYHLVFPPFCLQIAASYGSIVCLFEPVQQPDEKDASLTVSSLKCHFVAVQTCMHSGYTEQRELTLSGKALWISDHKQNVVASNKGN